MLSDKQKTALMIMAAVFLLAGDRLLKSLAVAGLFDQPVKIISGLFYLDFTPNIHIAFSIPLGGQFLFYFIIAIILVLCGYLAHLIKKGTINLAWPILLIIAGAASNAYDRWQYGFVIDYFDLKYFTVFNLADMMIVSGVILVCIIFLKKNKQIT